jgi:hypothetical protein
MTQDFSDTVSRNSVRLRLQDCCSRSGTLLVVVPVGPPTPPQAQVELRGLPNRLVSGGWSEVEFISMLHKAFGTMVLWAMAMSCSNATPCLSALSEDAGAQPDEVDVALDIAAGDFGPSADPLDARTSLARGIDQVPRSP